MTEAQLDQMLGLCEIGIEKAYDRKPEWCSLFAERFRMSSGRRKTTMRVIFGFSGDEKAYNLGGDSLSDLLVRISRECAFSKRVQQSAAVGSRRVLVTKKSEVIL